LAETSSPAINAFGTVSFAECQPSHLVLHGGQPMQGPTDGAPIKIVPVIWDTVNAQGQHLTFGYTTAQLDGFLANAFSSPWWSWIRRQYHLASVTIAPWATPALTTANRAKTVVFDSDIQTSSSRTSTTARCRCTAAGAPSAASST